MLVRNRLQYFENNFTAFSLGCLLFADSNIMDLLQGEQPEFQSEQEWGMEKVALGIQYPQYL